MLAPSGGLVPAPGRELELATKVTLRRAWGLPWGEELGEGNEDDGDEDVDLRRAAGDGGSCRVGPCVSCCCPGPKSIPTRLSTAAAILPLLLRLREPDLLPDGEEGGVETFNTPFSATGDEGEEGEGGCAWTAGSESGRLSEGSGEGGMSLALSPSPALPPFAVADDDRSTAGESSPSPCPKKFSDWVADRGVEGTREGGM